MHVSVYYKIPTIYLDNVATIILQKTINLLCQGHGKHLQLPQNYDSVSLCTAAARSCLTVADRHVSLL